MDGLVGKRLTIFPQEVDNVLLILPLDIEVIQVGILVFTLVSHIEVMA